MEILTVILQLVALTSAFTMMPDAGFGHMDFWGATQPSNFQMYQTVTQAPKPKKQEAISQEMVRLAMKNGASAQKPKQQATLEDRVRLAWKNHASAIKQTQNSQTTPNPLLDPWLSGNNNPSTNNQKQGGQMADPNAQMNMMRLKNVMRAKPQPNINLPGQGNVGPKQGLASLYQSYIKQMQQTTANTTKTRAHTPSPIISAYTPPPSQYGMLGGNTPSPSKTLAEIILDRLDKSNAKNNSSKPLKSKGCYYKEHWYAPLSEITKGQTGNWCYGTYCNHEGVVVHWDDDKCTHAPTTPSFISRTTTPGNNDMLGCFENGRWYDPGQDITNGRDRDTCYGTYCDINSKTVYWEDKCYATVPPPAGMGGGMSGMGGAGGMGGGMSGMGGAGGMGSTRGMGAAGGIGGMEGMEGMMAMAALAGMDGMSGLTRNGMSGGTRAGGMAGMTGMGAMGRMPGMGGQTGGMAATLDLFKR